MRFTPSMAYTLKDIADYIGIYYTIVSRAIKKLRVNIKSDIARPDPTRHLAMHGCYLPFIN